jgi:hypothetical protein
MLQRRDQGVRTSEHEFLGTAGNCMTHDHYQSDLLQTLGSVARALGGDLAAQG